MGSRSGDAGFNIPSPRVSSFKECRTQTFNQNVVLECQQMRCELPGAFCSTKNAFPRTLVCRPTLTPLPPLPPLTHPPIVV